MDRMQESRDLERRDGEPAPIIRRAEEPPPYAGYGAYLEPEDKAHLRDYLRALRKRWLLVLSITLFVTASTFVYLARKPDIYEAQARVQVDLENNPATGNSKGGSVIYSGSSDPTYFNTQLQILKGSGLLRRVVKTLDLENNPEFLRPRSQNRLTWRGVKESFGLANKQPEKAQPGDEAKPPVQPAADKPSDDLAEANRLAPFVERLRARLEIAPVRETRMPVKDTRLIEISFEHPDPHVAAKVANTIAETFVLSNLEKKVDTNSSASDFLQKRVAELQAQIRNGEERLINYSRSTGLLSLEPSTNTVVERLVGLNRQLLEAENERKLAEAAYKAGTRPGAAENLAAESDKLTNEAKSKLADLRAKRAQLLVEVTPEWPEVKEIDQQIAVLEKYLEDSRKEWVSTVSGNLETRYQQALARESALRADFDKQRSETLTQNAAAINYRIIQQEIETNKGLLEGLLQRLRENDVVLVGTPNNIRVVDFAIVPRKPVGPHRTLGLGLAFGLALLFAFGVALFFEYLDDSLASPEDVERALRLPTLAIIPAVGGLTRRHLRPAITALQRRGNRRREAGEELLLNADSQAQIAEAYRQLRTSLLLSTAGRAPKTLLVTSSQQAEGKTTSAVNTAMSLAQMGASVLVIDADMRQPRIHTIFGLSNDNGLSSILSAEMSDAEMFSRIEQHGESGLYLLTAGPLPPNPAELLGSEQMKRLIKLMSLSFTHIIIDSPPVSFFADSVIVSTMVDGVLLVVHGEKSSLSLVRRSRKVLSDVGSRIFGVVLNNVKLPRESYYYNAN
jgi:polysaccharide biosynthesis transport protein